MDLSDLPGESSFTQEARDRNCKVVEPAEVFVSLYRSTLQIADGPGLASQRNCARLDGIEQVELVHMKEAASNDCVRAKGSIEPDFEWGFAGGRFQPPVALELHVPLVDRLRATSALRFR